MGWKEAWEVVKRPRGLPAVLLLTGGMVLLGFAVGKDGFFGEVTAAWIQAVGSILAILAAVRIDQGSARRLQDQRASERQAALEVRHEAMEECREALLWVADVMQMSGDRRGSTKWESPAYERVTRAKFLLDRLIERGEIFPEVEGLQHYIATRMVEFEELLDAREARLPLREVPNLDSLSHEVREIAKRMQEAFDEYVAGGW